MGGLLAIALVGIYLWASFAIIRRTKAVWRKTLAIAVLALIPTADAVYERVKLKQMCEAEGGLRVNRVVDNVEGFLARSSGELWLKKLHFKFIETQKDGKILRFTLTQNGEIEEKTVDKPKSVYKLERSEAKLNSFLKVSYSIKQTDTDEVIGRYVDFNYYGGWVNHFISIDGPTRVSHCVAGETDVGDIQVVEAVLRPAK